MCLEGNYAQRLEPQCPLSCSERGDPTICANYRGINLPPIEYKVLTGILCERLKPLAETLIGPYPKNNPKTQKRQIPEKTHETQGNTHHLFVDYIVAFDSPIRNRAFAAMSELGIPAKLIRLCRMTLSNSCSFIR